MPMGKPVTREQHEQILELAAQGLFYSVIAKRLGLHKDAVRHHVNGRHSDMITREKKE